MAASELLITKIPGRSGLFLAFKDGADLHTIARFSRGAESAEEFMAWAQRSGIRCERDPEQTKEG